MIVSDYCSRGLFRMPVSDDYSRFLFGMTVSDAYFRCLFQMTFPDDCSEWLFWMPRNDSFGLLFQMNISDACFRWLFRMTVLNSTTDSYFSDQSVFPRSIPISTNPSTDWSHDWFVFERWLPTVELWSRSPLIPIGSLSKNQCPIMFRCVKECVSYGLSFDN